MPIRQKACVGLISDCAGSSWGVEMTIQGLVNVLTPPGSPFESGHGKRWPKFEGEIAFPADYIEFINVYGSGRIADFVVIFNPFSNDEGTNFFEQFKQVLEDFRFLEASGGCYNYVVYPEAEGLIPVGVTDNGDYLFWVFDADINSDEWLTAMVSARSPEAEYFNCGLGRLLESVLSGEVKAKSLPDCFPGLIDFEPL